MAEIVLEGISKAFGDVQALESFDLVVADRRTVAIVGPSGCGKTTVLRLIAGFEPPDAGLIRIGPTVVSGPAWVPAFKRGIGYVPQDGGLFPHLTVGQNIAFGLARHEATDSRLRELLAMVSMDPGFLGRRPDQLSGGQQQRVALARAIAIEPHVVLLDEPFSALDTDLRVDTRSAVRSLLDATGITAILVTHDHDDALGFADEVALMNAGRVVRTGPPADVYS
jgi:iron(III) transport system ATP-binding protein